LKRKQNNTSTRNRQDLKFEVVDAGEMSETDAEGVASILAGWVMKDMKRESSGPRTSGTQQQLDQAGKELKGVQSVRSSTL
jgi:hypothetical protein